MVVSCPSPRSSLHFSVRNSRKDRSRRLGTSNGQSLAVLLIVPLVPRNQCSARNFISPGTSLLSVLPPSPAPMIMVIDISANSRATKKGNGISAFRNLSLRSRARNLTKNRRVRNVLQDFQGFSKNWKKCFSSRQYRRWIVVIVVVYSGAINFSRGDNLKRPFKFLMRPRGRRR